MGIKSERRITNYFLTICFILLIVVFIISMIAISKLVLTGINPIQKHVANTQTLLDDIEEVEKATITNTTVSELFLEEKDYFEFNYQGFKITSLAHSNVNENKSIVTFFFDKPVGESEGIHYVIIKNLSLLVQKDTLVYLSEEGTETGKFISHTDGTILLGTKESLKIKQIPKEWLLGKVFYIEEND